MLLANLTCDCGHVIMVLAKLRRLYSLISMQQLWWHCIGCSGNVRTIMPWHCLEVLLWLICVVVKWISKKLIWLLLVLMKKWKIPGNYGNVSTMLLWSIKNVNKLWSSVLHSGFYKYPTILYTHAFIDQMVSFCWLKYIAELVVECKSHQEGSV